MEFIVPAIIVLFIVIRIVINATKSNRSARPLAAIPFENKQRTGTSGHPVSPPPIPASRPVNHDHTTESGHFSETALVDRYLRRHSQGKTLKHHTHDYFDPEKDRSKSRAKEAQKRRTINRRKLLKTKNIKRAVIMKQILDRPNF